MPPSQTGLLAPGAGRRGVFTPRACVAALMIAVILGGFYAFMHYVHDHIHKYPFLMLLFPPFTVATIASTIPLFMFISYQPDFGGLNPAHPLHYATIARRCYAALARNNMKVTEKDL